MKGKQKCLVKLNDRQTGINRHDLPKGSERPARGRHSAGKGCLPGAREDVYKRQLAAFSTLLTVVFDALQLRAMLV